MADNETIQKHEVKKLPNKAFDFEYATQFKKQMLYLREHGINYTYMYKTKEYGIPTYKYTKTSRLFQVVAAFYNQQQNEKKFNQAKDMFDKGVPADPGIIGNIQVSMFIDPFTSTIKGVSYNTPDVSEYPEQQKTIQG